MKRVNIFKGMGVALVTPFKTDGSIDFGLLEGLVESQIEKGADFICVLGTTAETPCLTPEEKKTVIEAVVRKNAGRVPLLLGAGGNCTSDVIRYINNEIPNGIDGVLIVAPFYNRPSQEGLFQHFRAIANASHLPVLLYNVPGRTGVNLEAKTTLRIANECENVVAIKEASGKIDQIQEIIEHAPEGFEVISGDDAITCKLIQLGAIGVISVVGNAYPAEFSTMIHQTLEGKISEAEALNDKFKELFPLLCVDGNPSGIKGVLAAQHKIENLLRLPLTPVRPETQQAIENYISKADQLFK